jgi:hypothetical protein
MLLEFEARNNHVKVTQENATQLLYSYPLHYKRLTELGFQYSLPRKQTTFSEGFFFLTEFVKRHGHYVVPTHYPQNHFFTTRTSKVKLEKAMELSELGFYKKKR